MLYANRYTEQIIRQTRNWHLLDWTKFRNEFIPDYYEIKSKINDDYDKLEFDRWKLSKIKEFNGKESNKNFINKKVRYCV